MWPEKLHQSIISTHKLVEIKPNKRNKLNSATSLTHYLLRGSLFLIFSKTFISSLAASLYLSTFFMIFKATILVGLERKRSFTNDNYFKCDVLVQISTLDNSTKRSLSKGADNFVSVIDKITILIFKMTISIIFDCYRCVVNRILSSIRNTAFVGFCRQFTRCSNRWRFDWRSFRT